MFLATETDTAACGRALARCLRPDDVVLLDGPLGAGKTTLVRALAAELEADPTLVASPTYTLLHQYDGRWPIVHVDAYRLSGAGDLAALGFDDAAAGGVALIEWGERVASAFPAAWRVRLDHTPGGGRTVSIAPPAGRSAAGLL